MIGRATLFLARLLALVTIAVAVLTGLAVWRVASGPVSVELLTPILARALDDAAGAAGNLRTEVADTVLIWGGFDHPLELRLRGVKIDGADGHVIARIPELAVGLSLRSLARGRLALARLAVIGPTLHLERTAEGRLMLDLDGAAPAGERPALEVAPAAAENDGPLAGLLAALRQPTGEEGPLAALTQVSILQAALTLEDRATGVMWSVPAASLTARRGADGLRQAVGVAAAAGADVVVLVIQRQQLFALHPVHQRQVVVAQVGHQLVQRFRLVVDIEHQVFQPDQQDGGPRQAHRPPRIAARAHAENAVIHLFQPCLFFHGAGAIHGIGARAQLVEIPRQVL